MSDSTARLARGGLLAMLCSLGVLFLLTTTAAFAALPEGFGSEGPGAGQFFEPSGIAVDQGNGDVFIADRNNDRIDMFSGKGVFVRAWGWGVADGKTKAPQVCTTRCYGGTEAPFVGAGAGQFNSPEGIAVDNGGFSASEGDVYVVDAGNHRVQKFSPEGTFLLMFGGQVNVSSADVCVAGEEANCRSGVNAGGAGEFKSLEKRAIAVDANGTVLVGDENRVQEFSEAGTLLGEIKLPGVGLIENLAVDSADDLYVKGSALSGVRKFNMSGTALGSPRDEAGNGEAGEFQAITVGPSDELLVNDFRRPVHRLLGFDATGAPVAGFDAGTRAEDGLTGIAYSSGAGAVYVLNQFNEPLEGKHEARVRIVPVPPPGPFVVPGSEAVSEVTPTGARLCARVNAEGPGPTGYHFEHGPTTAYSQSTAVGELAAGGFEDQEVCATISGLSPETAYHFRVVAEDTASQVAHGADQSFASLPAVSIDGTWATEIQSTSARLDAHLDPHGLASEYRFEYGPTTAYGSSVRVPGGSLPETVSEEVQELLPDQTYHYRVIARNALNGPGQYVLGPDRTLTTQGDASTLPDGRIWEQVSPPNKHGFPLEPLTEEGGLIKSAAAGGKFTYVALGPVTGETEGVRSPEDSQLISTRESTGWSTKDITTRHEEIALIHPGGASEYKSFAEDLSTGIVEPVGDTPLSPQTTERTPYRRESDGTLVPLVTASNVPKGVRFGGEETLGTGSGFWGNGVEFITATPDLSHLLIESPQVLTDGFKPGFEPAGTSSIYEIEPGGGLQLISILPGSSRQPAAEAGLQVGVGNADHNMRGAISDDGNRVVFETEKFHLFLRDVALGQTLQLDVGQEHSQGGVGHPVFQAASSDGSRVFFTDETRLTNDATANEHEPDLYMCEISLNPEGHLSCALSDLSVDPTVGEAANVAGDVSAVDSSAEHVYFAASGVLTSAKETNAAGEHAVPGNCDSTGEAACNLYVYDTSTKQLSLVAVLSSHDDPDWSGRTAERQLGNLTARSSPNGEYFTFMSQRPLTGYDNLDANSGQPDEEVFIYDTGTGKLHCVSCDPTGARPHGVYDAESFPGLLVDHADSWRKHWLAGSIPGWTLARSAEGADYQSRYLSDSGRMFFTSPDALVPQAKNKVEDVYQYEPPGVGSCTTERSTYSSVSEGCVSLISSGTAKEESAFLDASENGEEVFFLTQAPLATSDTDSAYDVYDAHVCSASSLCPPAPAPPAAECSGDSCQNPVAPPTDSTPASLSYHGPGNASPAPAAVSPKPKPLTRAQLLARALRSCRTKHSRRKRTQCERAARKTYAAKTSKAARRKR